jgi:hypothetical protein
VDHKALQVLKDHKDRKGQEDRLVMPDHKDQAEYPVLKDRRALQVLKDHKG